jgi:DNA-binding HxlR family transcriptional regulator
VGDKYSLLVLREVYYGVHRFDALQRNTGAPRDILTARLRKLVEEGVLEKVLYQERPPRYEYRATKAGEDLRSVLLMLARWGDRHLVEEPPVVWVHDCGAELDPRICCRACGEEVRRGQVRPRFDDPTWDAHGPVAG